MSRKPQRIGAIDLGRGLYISRWKTDDGLRISVGTGSWSRAGIDIPDDPELVHAIEFFAADCVRVGVLYGAYPDRGDE